MAGSIYETIVGNIMANDGSALLNSASNAMDSYVKGVKARGDTLTQGFKDFGEGMKSTFDTAQDVVNTSAAYEKEKLDNSQKMLENQTKLVENEKNILKDQETIAKNNAISSSYQNALARQQQYVNEQKQNGDSQYYGNIVDNTLIEMLKTPEYGAGLVSAKEVKYYMDNPQLFERDARAGVNDKTGYGLSAQKAQYIQKALSSPELMSNYQQYSKMKIMETYSQNGWLLPEYEQQAALDAYASLGDNRLSDNLLGIRKEIAEAQKGIINQGDKTFVEMGTHILAADRVGNRFGGLGAPTSQQTATNNDKPQQTNGEGNNTGGNTTNNAPTTTNAKSNGRKELENAIETGSTISIVPTDENGNIVSINSLSEQPQTREERLKTLSPAFQEYLNSEFAPTFLKDTINTMLDDGEMYDAFMQEMEENNGDIKQTEFFKIFLKDKFDEFNDGQKAAEKNGEAKLGQAGANIVVLGLTAVGVKKAAGASIKAIGNTVKRIRDRDQNHLLDQLDVADTAINSPEFNKMSPEEKYKYALAHNNPTQALKVAGVNIETDLKEIQDLIARNDVVSDAIEANIAIENDNYDRARKAIEADPNLEGHQKLDKIRELEFDRGLAIRNRIIKVLENIDPKLIEPGLIEKIKTAYKEMDEAAIKVYEAEIEERFAKMREAEEAAAKAAADPNVPEKEKTRLQRIATYFKGLYADALKWGKDFADPRNHIGFSLKHQKGLINRVKGKYGLVDFAVLAIVGAAAYQGFNSIEEDTLENAKDTVVDMIQDEVGLNVGMSAAQAVIDLKKRNKIDTAEADPYFATLDVEKIKSLGRPELFNEGGVGAWLSENIVFDALNLVGANLNQEPEKAWDLFVKYLERRKQQALLNLSSKQGFNNQNERFKFSNYINTSGDIDGTIAKQNNNIQNAINRQNELMTKKSKYDLTEDETKELKEVNGIVKSAQSSKVIDNTDTKTKKVNEAFSLSMTGRAEPPVAMADKQGDALNEALGASMGLKNRGKIIADDGTEYNLVGQGQDATNIKEYEKIYSESPELFKAIRGLGENAIPLLKPYLSLFDLGSPNGLAAIHAIASDKDIIKYINSYNRALENYNNKQLSAKKLHKIEMQTDRDVGKRIASIIADFNEGGKEIEINGKKYTVGLSSLVNPDYRENNGSFIGNALAVTIMNRDKMHRDVYEAQFGGITARIKIIKNAKKKHGSDTLKMIDAYGSL